MKNMLQMLSGSCNSFALLHAPCGWMRSWRFLRSTGLMKVTPFFDPEQNLPEPDDILIICPFLIAIAQRTLMTAAGNGSQSEN